jgi:hypothetical protein
MFYKNISFTNSQAQVPGTLEAILKAPPSLYIYIYIYTGCPRRNGQYFGRVFLRSNYTDITQNTYIQSSMVTEILAREV